MSRVSITSEIQRFLKSRIRHGDIVIDATLGNGHDALFLANTIGDSGHLFGFDIQAVAVDNSSQKLRTHGCEDRATFFKQSHTQMAQLIPDDLHGRISCIMFNLGYLPGADKSVTTAIDSTIPALIQSCQLLTKHGLISVLAYTGHPGGMDEYCAIKQWAESLDTGHYNVSIQNLLPDHNLPPRWILIEKSDATNAL